MIDQEPQSVQPQPKQVSLDEYEEMVRKGKPGQREIPKALWDGMRSQESGGDANATSATGVRGRFQVTKATAAQYGYNRDDPFEQAAAAGTHLRKMFDSSPGEDDSAKWWAAVGKYYGGDGAVDANGNLSTRSVDGVSNPLRHVNRVRQYVEQYHAQNPPAQTEQAQQPAKTYDPGYGPWPEKDAKGRPYKPLTPEMAAWQAEGQANTDRDMAAQAANITEKPAGVAPSSRNRRAAQAAQAIAQINQAKQAAQSLFAQADQTQNIPTGQGVDDATALRQRAEYALERANELGRQHAKRFPDLIEVGFGNDTDPNGKMPNGQPRQWVYAKPKAGTDATYEQTRQQLSGAQSGRRRIESAQRQQNTQRLEGIDTGQTPISEADYQKAVERNQYAEDTGLTGTGLFPSARRGLLKGEAGFAQGVKDTTDLFNRAGGRAPGDPGLLTSVGKFFGDFSDEAAKRLAEAAKNLPPETLPQQIADAFGQAPGAIASIEMMTKLTGGSAMLGFGAKKALDARSRGITDPAELAKQFAIGAAEGKVFEKVGKIPSPLARIPAQAALGAGQSALDGGNPIVGAITNAGLDVAMGGAGRRGPAAGPESAAPEVRAVSPETMRLAERPRPNSVPLVTRADGRVRAPLPSEPIPELAPVYTRPPMSPADMALRRGPLPVSDLHRASVDPNYQPTDAAMGVRDRLFPELAPRQAQQRPAPIEPPAQSSDQATAPLLPTTEPSTVPPQSANFRAVADAAKIEAAQAERVGNYGAAAAQYDAARQTLVRLRRQSTKNGDPQMLADLDAEISLANQNKVQALNRNRANARQQAKIENAPTAEVQQPEVVRDQAAKPPQNIPNNISEVAPLLRPEAQVNPEGGIPKLPENSVNFARLAERQNAQRAEAPAERSPANTEDLTVAGLIKRRLGGFRVSDRGEARVLSGREGNALVGLVSKDSPHGTEEVAHVLHEQGRTLDDGRPFVEDGRVVASEADVLDYMRAHGKEKVGGTNALNDRLAQEEADYYANRPQTEPIDRQLASIGLREKAGEIDAMEAQRERNRLGVDPQYAESPAAGRQPLDDRSPYLTGATIERDGAVHVVRDDKGGILAVNANREAAIRNAADALKGGGDFAIDESGRSVYAPEAEARDVTPAQSSPLRSVYRKLGTSDPEAISRLLRNADRRFKKSATPEEAAASARAHDRVSRLTPEDHAALAGVIPGYKFHPVDSEYQGEGSYGRHVRDIPDTEQNAQLDANHQDLMGFFDEMAKGDKSLTDREVAGIRANKARTEWAREVAGEHKDHSVVLSVLAKRETPESSRWMDLYGKLRRNGLDQNEQSEFRRLGSAAGLKRDFINSIFRDGQQQARDVRRGKPSESTAQSPSAEASQRATGTYGRESEITPQSRTEPAGQAPRAGLRGDEDSAVQEEVRPRTVSHNNPAIDGKPIVAERADGKVIVANPDNKTGVSVVKDQSKLAISPAPAKRGETQRGETAGAIKGGDAVTWKDSKGEQSGTVDVVRSGYATIKKADGGSEVVNVRRLTSGQGGERDSAASLRGPKPSPSSDVNYWQTPALERPPQSHEDAQSLVADARAEFRPRTRNEAGTVWTNQQGAYVIGSAMRQLGTDIAPHSLGGVNLRVERASEIADLIRDRASAYGDGKALTEIANHLDAAITDAKANGKSHVVIADSTLTGASGRRALTDVKQTLREERFHGWQREAGLLTDERGGAIDRHFAADPIYGKIRAKLIQDGYDRTDAAGLAIEAPAKLASGQSEQFGLTPEQAHDFLFRYAGFLTRRYGTDVTKALRNFTPSAKAAFEDAADIAGQRPAGTDRGSAFQRPGAAAEGQGAGESRGSAASLRRRENTAGEDGGNQENRQEEVRRSVRPASIADLRAIGNPRLQQSQAARSSAGLSSESPKPSGRNSQPKTADDYFKEQMARSPVDPKVDRMGDRVKEEAKKAAQNAADKVKLGKMTQEHADNIKTAVDALLVAGRLNDASAIRQARKDLHVAQEAASGSIGRKLKQAARVGLHPISSVQTAVFGTDFSYVGRQAAPLTFNPLNVFNTARAFKLLYNATGREEATGGTILPKAKGAEYVRQQLESHPRYDLANRAGLELALTSHPEEIYQNNIVSKLPWVKRMEAGNEAFLDYMRLQEFGKYADAIDATSQTQAQKDAGYRRGAAIVNDLTGRADLGQGKLKAMADATNGIFSSPRLNISHIKLLDPTRIARELYHNPAVGQRMLKDATAMMSTMGGMMALGNYTGMWSVGLNPDDSDFLKFKIGNTRYDPGFGELPLIRLFFKVGKTAYKMEEDARLGTAQSEKELKAAAKESIRALGSWGEGRLGPLPSYVWNLWKGQDFLGRPVKLSQFAHPSDPNSPYRRLLVPASAGNISSSIMTGVKDGFGKGAAEFVKTVPTEMFGIGTNTYEKTKKPTKGAASDMFSPSGGNGRGSKKDMFAP